METFLSILTWVGVGISIGLGLVIVVAVAAFLIWLYGKLFPKEKDSEKEFSSRMYAPTSVLFSEAAGRDAKIYGTDSALKKSIADFRAKCWNEDIVVPNFQIYVLQDMKIDFDCLIRIDGKEIFRGKIEDESGKSADGFVMEKIRRHFAEKMISEVAEQEEKNEQN